MQQTYDYKSYSYSELASARLMSIISHPKLRRFDQVPTLISEDGCATTPKDQYLSNIVKLT